MLPSVGMNEWEDRRRTVSVVRPTQLTLRRALIQIVAGPAAERTFDLEGTARIGSSGIADVVVHDPKVSGLHCEVSIDAEVRVRDLGSKNGTFIGSVRIREAFVSPGETIAVGDTLFRIVPSEQSVDVPLHADDQFHGLVGSSAPMRALTARLAASAQSESTILIEGETGTGKERVADAIHSASRRAQGPFVVVDCGSLTVALTESELFGHERGAFTGADQRRAGAFERARGGTVFLDEIGELPLALQPKLLRLLESRKVRRLGGQAEIPLDLRVVAATHQDLAVEVSRGRFREDLYYRLAVIKVRVPSLRERRDDIPQLASLFIRQLGADPGAYLTPTALAALVEHDWPGNVRELHNEIERAVTLLRPIKPNRPTPADPATILPLSGVDLSRPLGENKRRLMEDIERLYLPAVIARCGGNLTEVARQSGMDRVSIYRIMHRLGLTRE
jgi:DNA-binding NtrC family response regulator